MQKECHKLIKYWTQLNKKILHLFWVRIDLWVWKQFIFCFRPLHRQLSCQFAPRVVNFLWNCKNHSSVQFQTDGKFRRNICNPCPVPHSPMTATKLNFTQFLSSNTGPRSPHRCSLDQKLPVQEFLKSEFFANPSLDYSFNIQKKPARP